MENVELKNGIEDSFGKRLKSVRKDRNLSQAELAKIVGVSASAIGMYEQNRREPDRKILLKICNTLNVSTDEILGVQEERISSSRELDELISSFIKFLRTKKDLLFNGEPIDESNLESVAKALRIASAIAVASKC